MEIFFNGKSTLKHYGLILQSCFRTPPIRKRYLYSVAGADGQTDLLKGMGPPRYEPRTIRATFKISTPNPQQVFDRLVNELEGQTVSIVLPGELPYYMVGDIHISSGYIKLGGEIIIIATCLPWRYFRQEVVIDVAASDVDVVHTWHNSGTRDAVPELTVHEPIYITQDGVETNYQTGTYLMPDFSIPGGGSVSATIRGGAFIVRYKEAIL